MLGILVAGCSSLPADLPAQWQAFKVRFVTAQGRVVDTAAGGVSHSEGQGIAMLAAVHANDRKAFETIWQWTRTALQIRSDRLFAWRWRPDEEPPVGDLNNAADGDVLIAWALLRAAETWRYPPYREQAAAIVADLERQVVDTAFGPVLRPGAQGFHRDDVEVVNLSYWIFPAWQDFARYFGPEPWQELIASGRTLLEAARFGRWGLPPDWLQIAGDDVQIAGKHGSRCSYDAIRIPVYVVWAGLAGELSLQAFRDFWGYFDGARFTPDWTDLRDDSVGSYDMPLGFYHVRSLVEARYGRKYVPRAKAVDARPDSEHYYSAALRLLVAMAREGLPGRP